jgi:gliding motility-associated-like protein
VLDYSDLDDQKDVSIEIIDRYGYLIFKSKPNQYKWNGMVNNQPIPTGTYWYVVKWIDKDTKIPISYSDWVLVKNRN